MAEKNRREREREVRESEIIVAAEGVFCQKGYDNASMDEIATAAEFTKRTLYQYFVNKEDLYFAVALKGFRKLFAYIQEASKEASTGYLKIYQACFGYYQFYKDYPEIMRLLSYIGYVRKKSLIISEKQKKFMNFNDEIFESLTRVILEGKEDGSIRPDLDARKVSFSLIFVMTGFFNQLSTTGETFADKFALDQEDFSHFTMDLLLSSIMNTKSLECK